MSTTRKKAKRPKANHRQPIKALADLHDLIGRLHPFAVLNGKRDRLTLVDRQKAAWLLNRIAADEDVRDDFFTTVRHRPKATDTRDKVAAAFLYHARVTLGEASGKVLVGKVAKQIGLTDKQVEHAARDYKESTLANITALSEKNLRAIVEANATPRSRPTSRGGCC